MKIHRWEDLKRTKLSAEQLAEIERAVAEEVDHLGPHQASEIRHALRRRQWRLAAVWCADFVDARILRHRWYWVCLRVGRSSWWD